MKKIIPLVFLTIFSYGAEENPDQNSKEIALLETDSFYPYTIPPPSNEGLDITPVYRKQKSSFISVGLSMLVPGLGHAYLGDYKTASALFGSFAVLANFEIKPVKFIEEYNFVSSSNIWSYGIYAAYRDVRAYNGNRGYLYPMPTENLNDLALAPFRLSVLRKPEVWGGFLGALAVAVGINYFYQIKHSPSASIIPKDISPLQAFPVGIGEEALFRGYLQSRLSETFTPWGGIAISALAFGAMHIPNAQLLAHEERKDYYRYSIPVITAAGVYFGWMTYKNTSLKESVAMHSWYDFVLFLSASLANSAAIGKPSFALSFSF